MNKIALVALVALFLAPGALAALEIDAVNYKPTPAEPGKILDLWVTLTSTFGDSTDTVFEIDLRNESGTSTFPFILVDGQDAQKRLGTIKGGQSALVKYALLVDPLATSGDYPITFKFGPKNRLQSTSYSISVTGKNPQVELVQSENTNGAPGDVLETALSLKNTGTSKAVNVLVGVPEDRTVTTTGVVVRREVIPVGVSLLYVDEIAPGEEKTITLPLAIDPTADVRTYSVPLSITWEDTESNEFSRTRYVGVHVNADPEIDAIISNVKPAAYPGGTSEIEVSIFNVGKGAAQNIVVSVESDAVDSFDQSKQFIGTLESDDSDLFRVKAKISGDAALGDHPFDVSVAFKEDGGTATIMEKIPLTLRVSAPQSGSGEGTTTLAIAVIVIVAAYWLWRRRKRRK